MSIHDANLAFGDDRNDSPRPDDTWASWAWLHRHIAAQRMLAAIRQRNYSLLQRHWLVAAARAELEHITSVEQSDVSVMSNPAAVALREAVPYPTLLTRADSGPIIQISHAEVDPLLVATVPWHPARIAETVGRLTSGEDVPIPSDMAVRDSTGTGIFECDNGNHRIARAQIEGHDSICVQHVEVVVAAPVDPVAVRFTQIRGDEGWTAATSAGEKLVTASSRHWSVDAATVRWYAQMGARIVGEGGK